MHDIGDLRCGKSHGFQLSVMGKYSLRSIVKGDLSIVHHDQSLCIFRNILHTVGNQNDRDSSHFMKFCDLVQNIVSSFRVQTCGRLIQDQDLRVHCQNSGNGNSFLLTSGKFKRRFAVIFLFEPYMLQGFFCFHFCLFPG